MPRTATFRSLLLSMSVLALGACGGESHAPSPKTPAPLPPVSDVNASAPQPLAASDTLTPVIPSATTTSITTTTTAAPVAAGGITVEERIAKLEQTVGSLRTDYDRIMPAFASLNTTNERIQTLLDEIERDTGKRPAAATVPEPTSTPVVAETTTVTTTTTPAPMTAPPITAEPQAPTTTVTTQTTKTESKPAVTSAPTAGTTGTVNGVRIGEHGTKTRFVIDISGKTKPEFKYDLDNGEKLLLVDLPTMGWAGSQSGKGGAAAPLVEGWTVQPGQNGGSTLAIQLKKNPVHAVLAARRQGSGPSGYGHRRRYLIIL
jgi:hypothetical protein